MRAFRRVAVIREVDRSRTRKRVRAPEALLWIERPFVLNQLRCASACADVPVRDGVLKGSPSHLGSGRGAGTLLSSKRRGPRDLAVSRQIDERSS